MNLTVILQQEACGRVSACCPQLVGCHTFGDTPDEAMAHIREAIELYLEDMPPEEICRRISHVEIRDVEI
jgi:predicted RNase H-like HicB family nuclease